MPKITQLPSGSFHTLVYDRTENGKRKYKSFTAPTKGELKIMIAQYVADRKVEKTSDITVGEAIDQFIDNRKAVLSPSTVVGYRNIRNKRFRSIIDMPVSRLTSEMVQKAVNEEAKTKAPKTVINSYHVLIESIQAVRDFDPKINLPQKVKKEIQIPTTEEVNTILAAVRGTENELPFLLGAMCGMRRGEICALEWSDVDLKKGTIRISKSLSETEEKGLYIVKTTKTIAGTRTIRPPQTVLDVLEQNKKASGRITDVTPRALYERFQAVIKRTGVNHYRFHDLRHYAISVMLSLNIPKKYIADYMGHETENMIDRVYGHIMQDKKTDFENVLSSYFEKQMQNEMQNAAP